MSQTCGIVIAETDYLKKAIYRKCGNFVNKMWEFRQQTQEVQLTLRQQFSVKRGIATSPASCKQPAKCNAFVSNDDNNTRRTPNFDEINYSQDMQYRTQINIDHNSKPQTPSVQCFYVDYYMPPIKY